MVAKVEPGYLVDALPGKQNDRLGRQDYKLKICARLDHAPEDGEDFSLVRSDVQKFILPGITHWQHPSFFAYFPVSMMFNPDSDEILTTAWVLIPNCNSDA